MDLGHNYGEEKTMIDEKATRKRIELPDRFEELRRWCIEQCERPNDPIEYANTFEDPRDFTVHVFVKYRSGKKKKFQFDPFSYPPFIGEQYSEVQHEKAAM